MTQTIRYEDWEFTVEELGETIRNNIDSAQAHFHELEEQGKTLEDDCEYCIELGERIGDEIFPKKADDFEKRTIIKALDNNDKQAWRQIENYLLGLNFDETEVKEYLDGIHQVATSDYNYQNFEDFADELREVSHEEHQLYTLYYRKRTDDGRKYLPIEDKYCEDCEEII